MTLAETMVASSLMLLIMTGVFYMVNKGYQFFRVTNKAADSQRTILQLFTRLNLVVQNCKPIYIAVDPSNRGISFCSPFDDQGKAQFDYDAITDVSRVKWQAYEAIFLMPDKRVLTHRRKFPPTSSPLPPGDPGANASPANFISAGQGKELADEISRFEIVKKAAGDPLPYGGTASRDCYLVTVESGNQNDPSGYWLQLQTSVTPRN